MGNNGRQSARSETRSETPMIASRVPIFAPTRRPQSVRAWRVETPWGWALITGRLGQQHRDLLDAARMIAEAEQWTQDGRFHLKIDPARLRAALGGDKTNNQRIAEWIEDLRVARIEVHIGDRVIVGGLVSEYELSSDPTVLHPRPGALGNDRRYMRMSFSTGWSKLIETERAMYYSLAGVVNLRHGFSQAVARFCLSHREVRDTVVGMAVKVGAAGRVRDLRACLQDDTEALRLLGILIAGDAIRRLPGSDQSPVKGGGARPKSGGARPKSGGRDQSPVKRGGLSDISDISSGGSQKLAPLKTSKPKPKTSHPPPASGQRQSLRQKPTTKPTPKQLGRARRGLESILKGSVIGNPQPTRTEV